MIIVGIKGFAKEVLETLHQTGKLENLVFYDDVNKNVPDELFGKFPILKSLEAAKKHFETIDNTFTIGIGNSVLRKKYTINSPLLVEFVYQPSANRLVWVLMM